MKTLRLAFLCALLSACASAQILQQILQKAPVVAASNTWTLATGYPYKNDACTIGSTTCVVTLTNATTAGDLLVVIDNDSDGSQPNGITAGTAGACTGSAWVFPANAALTFAGLGTINGAYCLSAVGSVGSITFTRPFSATQWGIAVFAFHPSSSTAVAETVPVAVNNTSCGASFNCNAPSLGVTPTSDVIVSGMYAGQWACGVASPFTGFMEPIVALGGGAAYQLNASTSAGASFKQDTDGPACATTGTAGRALLITMGFK